VDDLPSAPVPATAASPSQPGGPPTQAETAEALASCLRAAGLPAEAQDYDPLGQKEIFFTVDEPFVFDLGNGRMQISRGAKGDQAALRRLVEAASQYGGQPGGSFNLNLGDTDTVVEIRPGAAASGAGEFPAYLIIGETDHSAVFAACLTESGYTQPIVQFDPTEELAEKQAQAEAAIKWAACAREHGYSAVQDPPPPQADNWATHAAAVLPANISAPELRQLLEQCPNFDAAAQAVYDQAARQFGPDATAEDWVELEYPVQPQIAFDSPLGTALAVGDPPPAGAGPAEVAHLEELIAILAEAYNAYFAAAGSLG
jgi:hypothetical protein